MTRTNDLHRPIGVFDSGVGGLTVLKALKEALPREDLVYLGDTARLPYGTKSPASISRYACQASAMLAARDVKLLVVACNTASAVALEALRGMMGSVPVVGVVGPGAEAAVACSPAGTHLVLATETTVRLGAYRSAIRALDTSATVHELACEMLVALAEEGWTEGSIAEAIVRRYLDMLDTTAANPDTIILGCTHFPLLRDAIAGVAGAEVAIVDSAFTTAKHVAGVLEDRGLLGTTDRPGTLSLLATDGATRFARVGGRFLGAALDATDVELIDL